jgi:hypothetical protein
MAYTIINGSFEQNGIHIEPESLFKLGKVSAFSDGLEIEFVISKRPAQIQFVFEVIPNPIFVLLFRGKALGKEQTNALVKRGYFISESRRVHFVSSRICEHLVSAFGDFSLLRLMKLLRSLYQEGLISEFPSALFEQLRINEKQEAHYENLFVQSLYPYQEEGVNWLSFCAENGIGTILADDMGLGKTAQVIALCCDVLGKNPNSKILIVVPNPLLDNWVREFQFFAPSLIPYLHYGKSRRGISCAFDEQNIIITPYTTMSSDIAMFEDMNFDLALFDEASMLKNPKSSRYLSGRRLNVGV